jgi:hypothetical protein
MVADFWQVLRFGARILIKQPGFTLIAVITLSLGIGANSAIFSFINALLFKPLRGVADPERLVQVSRTYEGRGFSDCSYPDYLDYRNQNTVMTGLAVNRSTSFNLNTGRIAERVEGELVSGNYFDLLRVRPARGRLLTPADESEGGGNLVAVISFGLWNRHFDTDPDVVGKTIKLNGYDYTVVGVADEEFAGIKAGSKLDVWVPITTLRQTNPSESSAKFDLLSQRGASWLEMFVWPACIGAGRRRVIWGAGLHGHAAHTGDRTSHCTRRAKT